MKIAIIGGGNMGTAIAGALKNKHLDLPRLIVADRNVNQHEKFASLEVDVTDSNVDACLDADVVILAVKPQNLSELKLSGKFGEDAIVISIMAGVSVVAISEALTGHKFIARVMPNLPALISEGISGLYAPDLDEEQKSVVYEILKTFGDYVEVSEEADIDKVTAISGCGPAYFFYFISCLRDAGVELGLSREIAEKLAMKTGLGSVKYADLDMDSLEDLCGRVASKGGSTEKALQVLNNRGLKEIISEACKAAKDRATELGD